MTPGVHTFILKLWLEPNTGGESADEWRGERSQVSSGQVLHFRAIASIGPAVQRLLEQVSNTGAATPGGTSHLGGRHRDTLKGAD